MVFLLLHFLNLSKNCNFSCTGTLHQRLTWFKKKKMDRSFFEKFYFMYRSFMYSTLHLELPNDFFRHLKHLFF